MSTTKLTFRQLPFLCHLFCIICSQMGVLQPGCNDLHLDVCNHRTNVPFPDLVGMQHSALRDFEDRVGLPRKGQNNFHTDKTRLSLPTCPFWSWPFLIWGPYARTGGNAISSSVRHIPHTLLYFNASHQCCAEESYDSG